ncbi:MAG TPA: metalloregulator ArsR/SmtB family transcription factor [Actinomycetota bacterium]|jgi:DNA-binding transcriptional ArsR family regulator
MSRDVATDAMRLKALGHPVRLGIALRLAREPETCACDFADVFAVSQPTVSEHLRVLRTAGIVTTKRRGTQICYSLDPSAIRQIRSILASLEPARARRSA